MFELVRQSSHFVATLEGVVTDDDFIRCFTEIASVSVAEPKTNLLVDLSGIKRLSVGSGTVRRAADLFRPLRENVTRKVAIVAPREESFGMARMYQLMRPPSASELNIFRTAAGAMEWLDVS
jgi:hypothetical protein